MSAHPRPTVVGDGPAPSEDLTFTAYDSDGNPVCIGCLEGPIMWAARANSGKGKCGCPVGDRRLPPVESKADALLFIQKALDELDRERLHHPLSCVCGFCSAAHILTGGRF